MRRHKEIFRVGIKGCHPVFRASDILSYRSRANCAVPHDDLPRWIEHALGLLVSCVGVIRFPAKLIQNVMTFLRSVIPIYLYV